MAATFNELPPFPGIRDDGLDFLEELRSEAHQDRSWFNERKHLYTDELRWPMRCLVADVLRNLQNGQSSKLHGDPRKSVFRIYRDVRFSKNKRPYQNHVACKFTVDPGLGESDGLVYVHVEPPDSFFVAAGLYSPPVKRLRPLRHRIINEAAIWADVVAKLRQNKLSIQSHGDDLKGMPRGFAEYRDHEMADYLKWTSFLVNRDLDRASVQSPALTSAIIDFTEAAWPLLRFVSETRQG